MRGISLLDFKRRRGAFLQRTTYTNVMSVQVSATTPKKSQPSAEYLKHPDEERNLIPPL